MKELNKEQLNKVFGGAGEITSVLPLIINFKNASGEDDSREVEIGFQGEPSAELIESAAKIWCQENSVEYLAHSIKSLDGIKIK